MLIRCSLDFDSDFLSDEFFNNLQGFFSLNGDHKISLFDYYENLLEIYHDFNGGFVFYIQKPDDSKSPFSFECDSFESLKNKLNEYYGNICRRNEETS